MMQRRSFLLSALATAVVPPAASVAGVLPAAGFAAQLQQALGVALGDPELAAKLAPVLLDVGFTWEAPAQPAASFQTIIAYSFGNRPALPGSSQPAPGPVNQELARAVVEAQRRSKASRIFAQWEIASFLRDQKGIGDVIAIDPVVLPDHSIQYLSTDGVAQAVVTHVGGDASKLGRVCVIGHHDHAKRCVETSRGRGMDAWAMKDLSLPLTYDPQSDQPWTHSREIYLIHDMAAQMMQIRAARLAAQTT
jgi:hypothetical protein